MKNKCVTVFGVGFATGILSLLFASFLSDTFFSTPLLDDYYIIQTEIGQKRTPKESLIHSSDNQLASQKKELSDANNHPIPENELFFEQTTELPIEKELKNSEESKIKSRIAEAIDELTINDLKRIEYILKGLNAKTPKELFDNELIDETWSFRKQAELEYSYYDESLLKDIGNLDSIVCKSKHCRIRVNLTTEQNFNPSAVYGWIRPVSVAVERKLNENSYKVIEIFTARKE